MKKHAAARQVKNDERNDHGEAMTDAKQPPPKQLLLENQICFPLYSASNAVIRAYRPLLDELNITYLQYMALMVLWEQRSLNVKELGQRLLLNSGTLTPLLKRLEGKGFVVRERCKVDERARIITITDEGLALRKRAEDIPEKLLWKIELAAQQRQQLKQLCQQVLSVLGDDH